MKTLKQEFDFLYNQETELEKEYKQLLRKFGPVVDVEKSMTNIAQLEEIKLFHEKLDLFIQAQYDFFTTVFEIYYSQNPNEPNAIKVLEIINTYKTLDKKIGTPQYNKVSSIFMKMIRASANRTGFKYLKHDLNLLKFSKFPAFLFSVLALLSATLFEKFTFSQAPVKSVRLFNFTNKMLGFLGYTIKKSELSALFSADSSIVTIWAGVHLHSVLDAGLINSFVPKDTICFLAGDQAFPKWINDCWESNPSGIILVGSGRPSPVLEAVKYFEAGSSKNLFINPQGDIPGGHKEILPVREKFCTGFLKELSDRGISFQIVPLTYLTNSRFLNDTTYDFRGELVYQIEKPISSDALKTVFKNENVESVGIMLRQLWIDRLSKPEAPIGGANRIRDNVLAYSFYFRHNLKFSTFISEIL